MADANASTPSGIDFAQIARRLARGDIAMGLGVLGLLVMLILPLPKALLDVMLAVSVSFSVLILMTALFIKSPLEFTAFPAILLVATMLRLGLNVASTRLILSEGQSGTAAAGDIIEAFGSFVMQGNFVIGIIVFIILVIVNFVVITKGSGRIAEVAARFTLDAMPGKQMAIDADLSSGLINEDEARKRRKELEEQSNFFGAMDGASKFVRGDAMAGILITSINLIGGMIIGVAQSGMDFGSAANTFSTLTIGDGLVAQIPSLLLSTAAAIMVTRVNSESDVREQVFAQMFASPKALTVAAGILTVMGLIPGMPHFAFLSLALACGAVAFWINGRVERDAGLVADRERQQLLLDQQDQQAESSELGWEDVAPVDIIGLEVGYRLIPMVDKNQTGELLGRIKGIRKKLSQETGFLVPAVHIRDNLELQPNAYRISLMGVTIGEADIHPDRHLAINPGQVFGTVEGIAAKDPAFGLDAVWINAELQDHAQTLGYTVVDASTVIATHMNQLLQKHLHELLGHEELQQMLDRLARFSPKLAETLVPDTVSMSTLLKVLKSLLQEQVPVRDFRTIAESIAANAAVNQDPVQLTSAVRVALARSIVHGIYGSSADLPVITLAPSMEQMLLKAIASPSASDMTLEPGLAEQLQRSITDAVRSQELKGHPAVLLVAAPLRHVLSRFVRYGSTELQVLSYNEIPADKQVTIETTVG